MISQVLHRAWATIDIAAVKHNLSTIRSKIGNAKILAVVKADAYGHGLENIVPNIYTEVDGFAVATINEGIQCRELQQTKPIVVLSEFWHEQQLKEFESYSLDPVAHTTEQIPWLLNYKGSDLSVWVKFDTGMNRLGLNPDCVKGVFNQLNENPSISNVRVFSHLANASIVDSNYTNVQLETFKNTIEGLNCESSLANSAGLMSWNSTVFDWVRPGLILFGVSPFASSSTSDLALQPTMRLYAKILSVKNINKRSSVGYGGEFTTKRDTTIAIVGVGYGDGYPRVLDSRACVFVGDKRAPIIGSISMDMITIDVTDIEDVKLGDVVELWGDKLTVEEVATWAGTIPYELLCKVTKRVTRLLINHNTETT